MLIKVTDKLLTPNEDDVVELSEFKQHLRWPASDTSEDVTMSRKLASAYEDFKEFTGRPLLVETWQMFFDEFYDRVTLSKAPVDVESIVVKYYDTSNVLQTLSASEYKIQDGGEFGLTVIHFDGNTPSLYDKPQAVYVQYDAGYETVPNKVIAGILEQASDYFEYRMSDAKKPPVPSAYRVWFPYKVFYNNLC
jgi:uncharacterized phiE125 gp8 family phage protein